MVRAGTGLTALLLAIAPAALCGQQAPPPPAEAGDSAAPVGSDPVGLLLENRDALRLSPPVVDQLVQINLDLFRRTRRIQRGIDSIIPPADDAFGARRARPLTPEQRERLAPLMAARRAELLRARDAAWELLTPEQRDQARRLGERTAGRGGRRPPGEP